MSITVKILTEDNKIYNMDLKLFYERSTFIHDMFESSIESEDFSFEDPVPIAVRIDMLYRIEEYLNNYRHTEIPKINRPLNHTVLHNEDNVSDWDIKFINSLTEDELFKLLLSCNYMGIESLKDLCCAAIAISLRPVIKEIEEKYEIEGGITPEQMKRLEEEKNWIK